MANNDVRVAAACIYYDMREYRTQGRYGGGMFEFGKG